MKTNGKRILVEYGKHGEFFWDATGEELPRSALAILKDRFEQGYYYYEPGEEPKWNGLPVDEIKALRKIDEDAYKAVAKKYNAWRRDHTEWQLDVREWNEIKKAIEEEDGGLAWEILRSRGDHEYERIELESLATASEQA